MNKWPYEVACLQRSVILRAVRDPEWQEFRRSLKGLDTETKLDKLFERKEASSRWTSDVQIDNYINALLRGGQLVRSGNTIKVNR